MAYFSLLKQQDLDPQQADDLEFLRRYAAENDSFLHVEVRREAHRVHPE